jgi:ATP-dependent Clp protease adaptor protein ClpS
MSHAESDTLEQVRIGYPSQYNVLIHNDDQTPFAFVIQLLVEIFDHDLASAEKVTTQVHESSKGVAGTYSREIADQKVAESNEVISATGFPLKVTKEKVS